MKTIKDIAKDVKISEDGKFERFRAPQDFKELIAKATKKFGFASKSEFIRTAIRNEIERRGGL